ncbi:NAD(P)-binding domain-containing protein [Paenibacillus flagellatus]|uniref:Tartronate semialdehyde reductase n=1 Tax=Paenibacillus flagellatus TaxID=2211139 RepID=A0A2V5K5K4_9BACL|nr:tartronate semialdehyde reductase [Paenibacillus flagellatus]
MKKIGFIGLGTMGLPMAANLLRKGYPLTVYNRTADKNAELLRLGAEAAATPAEAARDADVLITMLSNDTAIRQTFYDPNGIMEGIRPGLTVIDCSTISPHTSKTLHAELAEHAVDFLDAPVTGSKPAAESGTLLFMVGGSEEALQEHRDVFEAMGSRIVYMGASGSGSYAKLAHNTMVGINAIGFVEGMALAAKANVDLEKFYEIVQAGGAASKQAELKGPKILNRDFATQFSMQLMHKDLRLASQLTDQLQLTAPLLNLAKNIYEMGLSKGLGELDLSAIVQCYEEWMDKTVETCKREEAQPDALLTKQDLNIERRRSVRVPMNIRLLLSVYQWEQEGAFSGQNIEGTLYDLSDSGLQLTSHFPLAQDMFVVIHFPQEAGLPPITARIIRVFSDGGLFRYGCMLSGLPPYTRIKLEEYIQLKLQLQEEAETNEQT